MATVAQIINRTQRQLLSGVVEERNKIASAVNTTATTITLTYEIAGIRQGSIIEIDAEQMYVWSVLESTKVATVERAFNGTVAAAHTNGSIVTVNPRFPRAQVLEAINDELADLSSPMNGLFQVKILDLSYNGSDRQINLPSISDVIDLIEVRNRYISSDYQQVNRVKLLRNMPTKDFGSGMALQFDQGVRQGDLRVSYRAPFTKFTIESENVQMNGGYPESAEDILVVGAQIRLIAPREIKRNFTESQGDTRRADEVSAGAVSNSIVSMLRMRRDRITAEAAKLTRQYPIFLQKV
jgi:hypothetical protein